MVTHDLLDSPGALPGRMGFTPSRSGLAVADRDASLALIDLASGTRRRVALERPVFAVEMLGESDALVIGSGGMPVFVDFAASVAIPALPNRARGFASDPTLRLGANGVVWSTGVASLGAARLTLPPPADVATTRAWLQQLARRSAPTRARSTAAE